MGPTKYPRQSILDPRNAYEKKFVPRKYFQEKFQLQEIPKRKNFEHTKYPRKKISITRKHDCTTALDQQDPRWHTTK